MDNGISQSQAVNFRESQGTYHFNVIAPASGTVEANQQNPYHSSSVMAAETGGEDSFGHGYYVRPDYVLLTGGNCHEIKFMFSGSYGDSGDSDGPGWTSFGSASYIGDGSGSAAVRLDISPIAWTSSVDGGCSGDNDAGSGSVLFVYNSTNRLL